MAATSSPGKRLLRSKSGLRIVPMSEGDRSPFELKEPEWIPDKLVRGRITGDRGVHVVVHLALGGVLKGRGTLISKGVVRYISGYSDMICIVKEVNMIPDKQVRGRITGDSGGHVVVHLALGEYGRGGARKLSRHCQVQLFWW